MISGLAQDLAQYVPLIVLGAVLGLDFVSLPQAMLSRPIVAATAAGALIGQPARGLTVGVALEFFALESMPFGASRYPEWGTASVVAGALYAMTPDGQAAALSFAVFAGLVTAGVGSWNMVVLRRWNAWWTKRKQRGLEKGSGLTMSGIQVMGLTSDLIRGALHTAVFLVGFDILRIALLAYIRVPGALSRAVVVGAASAVGLAAVWTVTHTTPKARWWLVGGLGLGLVMAVAFR